MEGILTGCDLEQEWMLSRWYQNLRKFHPDIPVAFGDLGMSEEAKNWCKARGILISESQIPTLSPPIEDSGFFFAEKKWHMSPQGWDMEEREKSFSWFRKPFLMKQSPFKRTIWLDLDCEFLGSLSPLFSIALPAAQLAIRSGPESIKLYSDDRKCFLRIKGVNSGVIVFEKESPLIDFWIYLTSQAFPYFWGDDNILSFAISQFRHPIKKIPYKYNWLIQWGYNSEAVIIHWMGKGKTLLKLLHSL